jgi:hypothetical protein
MNRLLAEPGGGPWVNWAWVEVSHGHFVGDVSSKHLRKFPLGTASSWITNFPYATSILPGYAWFNLYLLRQSQTWMRFYQRSIIKLHKKCETLSFPLSQILTSVTIYGSHYLKAKFLK